MLEPSFIRKDTILKVEMTQQYMLSGWIIFGLIFPVAEFADWSMAEWQAVSKPDCYV